MTNSSSLLQEIRENLRIALAALEDRGALKPGAVMVLGCSTSEILGEHIGKGSSQEIGDTVVDTILDYLEPLGVTLAVGCCEHLNRALVVPEELLKRDRLTQVVVRPALHAGGACGVAYYERLKAPVMAESLQADCGLDIGLTMIGMHLKPVAVPIRCAVKQICRAPLVLAVTRPKYVGGPRATYPD